MFEGCTGLTELPNNLLPATSLALHCYNNMFLDCTGIYGSLRSFNLLAQELVGSCYIGMFKNCTGITETPILGATTLANWCYCGMFQGCSSLTTSPIILPATNLPYGCYQNMFHSCTNLVNVPNNLISSASSIGNYSCAGMFYGCIKLTEMIDLDLETVSEGCYQSMYQNCSSLSSVIEKLPATTLATKCYRLMFQGYTNITTAPELQATALAEYCYQSMFDWCPKLSEIKMKATSWNDTSFTKWVNSVSASGTFYKDSALIEEHSVNRIPSGWTVINY